MIQVDCFDKKCDDMITLVCDCCGNRIDFDDRLDRLSNIEWIEYNFYIRYDHYHYHFCKECTQHGKSERTSYLKQIDLVFHKMFPKAVEITRDGKECGQYYSLYNCNHLAYALQSFGLNDENLSGDSTITQKVFANEFKKRCDRLTVVNCISVSPRLN